MAIEKTNKDSKTILETAHQRFAIAAEAEMEIRKEALEDWQFRAGDQWPEEIKNQRDIQHRPCITINRLPQFIRQVTNDQRQNRPAIKVSPVDDKADIETAKVLQGLIRHIEYDSGADAAYDTAFEGAAISGLGYFRLITEYLNPMSFDQVIKIKRISNAFSVYLDPFFRESDGSDANWGFVFEDMSKEDYEEQYPDSKQASMEDWKSLGNRVDGWAVENSCRVAEYFYREFKDETIVLLANGKSMLKSELEDFVERGLAVGDEYEIVNERTTKIPKIIWCKINAVEVLEKTEWPGSWIPIIPVLGDELNIDGKRKFEGIVRHAKDAQRMYNYWSPIRLSEKLPTPNGWTTMGEVKEGDYLFDENGDPCKVLGTSQIHQGRDCFKITFDDKSFIIADAEHGWTVEERGQRKSSWL